MLRPFNRHKALTGHPVVTRSGLIATKVRHTPGADSKWAIYAEIAGAFFYYTRASGRWVNNTKAHALDLFLLIDN